jgi:hypothetical protein
MVRSKGSGGGKYRSAISGRYVIAAHGRRSPRTTVREQGPQFLSCPYPANSLRHQGWWVAHSVRKDQPRSPLSLSFSSRVSATTQMDMPRSSQTANR